MFKVPERFRITGGAGPYNSSFMDGNNGAFWIPGPCGEHLKVIASDGMGWEHVSVSKRRHTPNWREMSFVKDMFWGPEDLVVQFHPPKSQYVNVHHNCLHLWRKIGFEFPLPPIECV